MASHSGGTSERSDVKFPMWRKKVDWSLLGPSGKGGGTVMPRWMWSAWHLEETFGDCPSRRDPRSVVTVHFDGRSYPGHVTIAKLGRENTPAYRLWLSDALTARLRRCFSMTYLRCLEQEVRSVAKPSAETETPFWEFVDIEFDCSLREFKLTAHYTQPAVFPKLFDYLITSGALDDLAGGPVQSSDEDEPASEELPTRSERKRQAVVNALREHDGNRTKAARALGISRRTIQNRIKELELEDK